MTRVTDQPGIVVHTRPYRESSLLLSVLTLDHGLVTLVGRGVRGGRRGRALQPFTALRLGWSGRSSLGTLAGFEVEKQHWFQGNALASAFYLTELITRLLDEREPHSRLFAGVRWALEEMDRGPSFVLRSFEKLLLEELEERVSQHLGTLEEERFRIYWDGMPVWGRLGMHSKLFASLKTNVIASTYCSSWIFSALDPEDPFNSMARAYTELFIVRGDDYKEQYIKEKLDFFKVDGIIYHDAKTCPNNSNCRYGMPQRLAEETGIPSLTINGDLNDLRLLSDEQTKTNVEAFIEQLEEG